MMWNYKTAKTELGFQKPLELHETNDKEENKSHLRKRESLSKKLKLHSHLKTMELYFACLEKRPINVDFYIEQIHLSRFRAKEHHFQTKTKHSYRRSSLKKTFKNILWQKESNLRGNNKNERKNKKQDKPKHMG